MTLERMSRESSNMLFMAAAVSDTNWNRPEDKYASPGGIWKQTLGAMSGGDTLWWKGDPNVSIFKSNYEFEKGAYSKYNFAFNVSVGAKSDFPGFINQMREDFKKSTLYLIEIELFGIILILVLLYSVLSARKQSKRNQIALAHLAHSIKTPIARIRLDTDSLIDELVASPSEEREIITAIGNECGRMEKAVQNAALSLESGKREMNMKECDLSQLFLDTVNAWQPQFKHSGVNLEIIRSDIQIRGAFDCDYLAIALDNIIDNSLRFTSLNLNNIKPEQAVIKTQLRKVGQNIRITVDDMGIGIPEPDRKHIFKRFGRAKKDAASGVTGLGLGLSLVKEIVEAHKGKVWVEDSELGGACFILELPCK